MNPSGALNLWVIGVLPVHSLRPPLGPLAELTTFRSEAEGVGLHARSRDWEDIDSLSRTGSWLVSSACYVQWRAAQRLFSAHQYGSIGSEDTDLNHWMSRTCISLGKPRSAIVRHKLEGSRLFSLWHSLGLTRHLSGLARKRGDADRQAEPW